MGKLSPPVLASTIPAFYSNDEGIVLTIPYSMNRSVSRSQIKEFSIKIKTNQSGDVIKTIATTNGIDADEIKIVENIDKLKIGQYYKIQVAYVNHQGEIGYYSTVALGKYTSKPEVSIMGLNKENLNSHMYDYIGEYKCSADITERPYNYRFDLYDNKGEVIASSGNLLHNTDGDDPEDPNKTIDCYTFAQDLLVGETHRIQYTVITNNGMTVSSPRYRITQKRSISPELQANLKVELNYDNGYINIDLIPNNLENPSKNITTGFFMVVRACEDTNYTVWETIHKFKLIAQIPKMHLCKDFTIEQGKNYRYAIQQYNSNGLRSNRLLSDIIYSDFEDAFLFDGKRQLKIKYNPKVSSFKKDLLETKTDTIGGKHPFIFRNGRVYYSEFPISGLISYQMDEENLFLSDKDYRLNEKTTNLTGENVASERVFKMKVLDWLTDGKPKVFRSPTEGNYIVRLMNSSLAPNETVGRMLHTFSSTAYEIADFNYTTLGEMGFITVDDMTSTSLQWETKSLRDSKTKQNLLTQKKIRTIRFDDMKPGDVILIKFNNGDQEHIKIGVTGSYYIDTGVDITEVQLETQHLGNGSMTYSYEYIKVPAFETVATVDVVEFPGQQFIGEHNILTELLYVYDETVGAWVENPKLELIEVYNIQVEKRPVQKIEAFHHNDPFLIYEYGKWLKDESGTPRPGYPKRTFKTNYYYDGEKGFNESGEPIAKYELYEPYIKLNGTVIGVDDIEETSYYRPGKLTELISGNGCLTTMSYQMCNITYNIENEAMETTDQNHYLYKLGQEMRNYYNAVQQLQALICDLTVVKEINEMEKYCDIIVNNFHSDLFAENNKICITFNAGIDTQDKVFEDGIWLVSGDGGKYDAAIHKENEVMTTLKVEANDIVQFEYTQEEREWNGKKYPVFNYGGVITMDEYIKQINDIRDEIEKSYTAYIIELINAQKEDQRRRGEIE